MKRKLLIVLSLLLFVAASLRAESIFPYKYQETKLDNELRVILIPMKNPGLVSYYTVVHAGSRDEVEPGKSGFAHFFEHMMFRGTDKYPPEKRNDILSNMGADTNAYTTDDFTNYYLHFPTKYLEQVIDLESDRFMNLKYSLPAFQTESRAVLGEYNKNFSNPFVQLDEKIRDVAFDKSSYKHTTIGFIKDIQNMPNEYEYSLQFFQRFYRPENCTILVLGNFDPAQTLTLIKKYYAPWKPGDYATKPIPEPEQSAERRGKIDYQGDTLPIVMAAYKAPAFAVDSKEYAALTLLADLAFGETSPLYQRLVLKEQKADFVQADNDPHRDPYLYQIYARVKDDKDLPAVEQSFYSTLEEMKQKPADPKRLADLKSNLKYGFLMSLDTSKRAGSALVRYIELTHNLEGIDTLFQTFQSVTPEDIQKVAQKYFDPKNRTVITLSGAKQ